MNKITNKQTNKQFLSQPNHVNYLCKYQDIFLGVSQDDSNNKKIKNKQTKKQTDK